METSSQTYGLYLWLGYNTVSSPQQGFRDLYVHRLYFKHRQRAIPADEVRHYHAHRCCVIEKWQLSVTPFELELHDLALADGVIAAPQLRLLTSSSHSSLTSVSLSDLVGLTNIGFREWLDEVGSSLRFLDLRDCVVKRLDEEERALDTIMPKMTSLRYLYIRGDVASALTIERYHLPGGNPTKYEVGSSIAIDLVVTLRALRHPLASFVYSHQIDPLVQKEALRVAGERGTHLEFSKRPLYYWLKIS